MDQHIELVNVEVAPSEIHDLLVHLLFGFWGEFAELDSGVDLFVPLLELFLLLWVEAVGEEALNQVCGSFHVVVFFGVLESDGKDFFSGFVAGHACGNLAHLDGLLFLFIFDIDLGDLWHVHFRFVKMRQGRVREVKAHNVFLVECNNYEAEPLDELDQVNHFSILITMLSVLFY